MDNQLGWRGKVGLILPAVQTVTEPLYHRIAPQGVAFFASRVLTPGNMVTGHGDMEKEAFRAARELATAEVDCIAYCCTASGILQGIEGDREFCRRMEKETGIPTTSTLSAMIEALEILRLRGLLLISPYPHELHAAEERFFQKAGFAVKSCSMEIESGVKFALVPPGEIYRFCRKNWDDKVDGLLISCMNFNAMPCIDPLERDLGKPVLSSHSATLWKILKTIGVQERVAGFGRLLAERL